MATYEVVDGTTVEKIEETRTSLTIELIDSQIAQIDTALAELSAKRTALLADRDAIETELTKLVA